MLLPVGSPDTSQGMERKSNFRRFGEAVVHGSVLASYCVEAFSLERLKTLTADQIAGRYEMFRRLSQFDVE